MWCVMSDLASVLLCSELCSLSVCWSCTLSINACDAGTAAYAGLFMHSCWVLLPVAPRSDWHWHWLRPMTNSRSPSHVSDPHERRQRLCAHCLNLAHKTRLKFVCKHLRAKYRRRGVFNRLTTGTDRTAMADPFFDEIRTEDGKYKYYVKGMAPCRTLRACTMSASVCVARLVKDTSNPSLQGATCNMCDG